MAPRTFLISAWPQWSGPLLAATLLTGPLLALPSLAGSVLVAPAAGSAPAPPAWADDGFDQEPEPAPVDPSEAAAELPAAEPASLEDLIAEFRVLKKELDEIDEKTRKEDDFLPCEAQLAEIGRLGTDEAATALIELSELDGWRGKLLDATARGLVLNGGEVARTTIMEWAADKKRPNNRRAAARGLAEFGNEADIVWLRDKRLKAEKEGAIKGAILEGLLDRKAEKLESLCLKAAKDKDKAYAAAGIRGIGVLHLDKGMKSVERRLGDPSEKVRKRCFEALGALGGDDAFSLLLEAYHDARNEGLRTDIAVQLRMAKTRKEIGVLIKEGIRDRDADVVKASVEALAFAAEHEPELCGPVLLEMLGDSDEEIRTAAIEGMVRARPEGAIQALIRRLDHDDFRTRTDAAWALSQLGDLPPEAEAKFIELTGDDRPAVRLHAVDALRWFIPSEDSYRAAVGSLRDELWSVRSAAIQTVFAFRRQDSLEPLVTVVEQEKGRVRDDAINVLMQLTGEDFGPLTQPWRLWLDDLDPGYVLPSAEEVAERIARRASGRSEGELLTEAEGSYHGIAVPRGGVVFILDISGSMDQMFDENTTFFQHFSQALMETVDNLKDDTDFNIVLFSSDARAWNEDKLVPAEGEYIEEAISYLDASRPGGATNLFAALELAFEFHETQTIFLLTDGDPTMGITITDVILAEIEYMNRDRRIQIHTIAAGDVKAEFLADLAASNGGEAVDLTHLGLNKKKRAEKEAEKDKKP